MKEYITIGKDMVQTVEIINKSRFIASAIKTDSVEEAVTFVNRISKQYYDATHNCYAYIVDETMKFSDNGEPSGTAGMPILDVLKKQKLNHLCVVVTRYFGGIKLGAGGLVRAYSGGASNVLNIAQKVTIRQITPASVTIPYNMLTITQQQIEKFGKIINIEYADNVRIFVNILSETKDEFVSNITNTTIGQGIIALEQEILGEF